MQIAYLHQGASLDLLTQTTDAQYGVCEFEPVRFNSPSIKS
jgi:hypothetical protein